MPALLEELIDGPGFVLLANLIDAAEAAQARSRILEVVASPSGSTFGKLNEKIGQQHLRGLLWHGEIFERLVQHPALIEIAEAMLGDDMVLGAYSARILYPGAIEMGVHIDYPYWAMRGPFTLPSAPSTRRFDATFSTLPLPMPKCVTPLGADSDCRSAAAAASMACRAELTWNIAPLNPRWSADGKELFFVAADGKMTEVPIKIGAGAKPSLEAGAPRALFSTPPLAHYNQGSFAYDVTADGKRFLFAAVADAVGSSPLLDVVTNWDKNRP